MKLIVSRMIPRNFLYLRPNHTFLNGFLAKTRVGDKLKVHRSLKRRSSNLSHLENRGYEVIHSSFQELDRLLQSGPQVVYCGFDPTAPSLHVGNLLALVGLLHFQRLGHQPVALVGGATALIGDPTHRALEREKLEKDRARENAERIVEIIHRVFENHRKYFWDDNDVDEAKDDFNGVTSRDPRPRLPAPIIVNNEEWYSSANVIDFLHETGRHFRMNSLLGRSSVQLRMESQDGMSLTEFVYQVALHFVQGSENEFVKSRLSLEAACNFVEMKRAVPHQPHLLALFQSHDWLHLFRTLGCRIQLGGKDQTGNIMSGIHLINKAVAGADGREEDAEKLFGVTVPILTSETTGQKIGKSSGGHSLWLCEDLTTSFELYQYFYNLWDSELEKFLRQLTFLSEEEIAEAKNLDSSKRLGQKLIAEKVVLLVHGKRGLSSARRCTNALFGANLDDLRKLSASEVAVTFPGAGVVEIPVHRQNHSRKETEKRGEDAALTDGRGRPVDNHAGNDAHRNSPTMTKWTLADVVVATRHCQKMILAKRPNFKPEVVENMAKTKALKLISEGAVKMNFAKMTDANLDDFDPYVLKVDRDTMDDDDLDQEVDDPDGWSLLTVAKKHHYVVKWVERNGDSLE